MESAKLPTINLLMEPLPEPHMALAINPRFIRLLKLDHQGWMTQLAYDGFTDTDVESLQNSVQESFNEAELAQNLAQLLRSIQDGTGESETNKALAQWTGNCGWSNIWEFVCAQEFPGPIDAPAYTGRHLLDIAASTLAFERTRRQPAVPTTGNWNMSEAELKEGMELAEMGMAEESAQWPPY